MPWLTPTVAWLGEPLADQTGASDLAPRCRKDLVEEALFARRRDLFAELSVVFMDTTSLSLEGQGGAELGRRGHSKDYRPDLHQMIASGARGIIRDTGAGGASLGCLMSGDAVLGGAQGPKVCRLTAGASRIRTCMGLFLSSGCFGFG
jgi:hypothetical protein